MRETIKEKCECCNAITYKYKDFCDNCKKDITTMRKRDEACSIQYIAHQYDEIDNGNPHFCSLVCLMDFMLSFDEDNEYCDIVGITPKMIKEYKERGSDL